MATLNNPGNFNCIAKLEANTDMPFFLLLGSDPLAAKRVRDWAADAALHGVNPAKVEEAVRCAYEMEVYANTNGKLPD